MTLPPRPYREWRTTAAARWRDAFFTFGHLLMRHARDGAVRESRDKAAAAETVSSALYRTFQILEGVTGADIGDGHTIEFALLARVRDSQTDAIVETFELAPDGEETLCMGYWLLEEGEFRA